MQITIKTKKDNPFLKRTEVAGTIVFEGATPSNAKLGEALAKELKVNELGLVVIKNIYTTFSRQEAKFNAAVYYDNNAKKNTEKLTSHMKKKIEEAKKAAAEKKEGEQ